MMAHSTIAASHEQHSHRSDVGHHHRIVTCTTWEEPGGRGIQHAANAIGELSPDLRRTFDTADPQNLFPDDFDLTPCGHVTAHRENILHGRVPNHISGSTHVHAEMTTTGDHV